MDKRTALVFGSTGLIGNLLVEELVRSQLYGKVKVFVRQSTGVSEPLVEEIVNDLANPESVEPYLNGDDLYICLGTTIKKAGSVANMEKVDRDLPVKVAELALRNGVKRIAVVSSVGASARSGNYYLRIKGEMEEGILRLGFVNTVILRPSLLLGERKEKRRGEFAGKVVMSIVSPLMVGKLKRYRGIHGKDVARAMIYLLQNEPVKKIYESEEIRSLAE